MAARDVTAAQGVAYPVPARTRSIAVGAAVGTGRIARRGAAAGLIVLMALGSFVLWAAIPLGGLWLASRFSESTTQLGATPALVAFVGMPAAMALSGMVLAPLARLYLRVSGARRVRRAPAYRHSISDSSAPEPASVPEAITMVSALAALIVVSWTVL